MNNEKNCPICYEEYCNGTGPKDSILNHDIDENDCTHWFCTNCIRNFYENDINKCPICRRCIYELVWYLCIMMKCGFQITSQITSLIKFVFYNFFIKNN